MAADAVLVVRAGLQGEHKGLLLLGIFLSALGVALAAAGWARHRQLRSPRPRPVSRTLAGVAGAGVVLTACAVLWAVLP